MSETVVDFDLNFVTGKITATGHAGTHNNIHVTATPKQGNKVEFLVFAQHFV